MQQQDVGLFFRKRYLVCLLTSVGMVFNYILRTNLSMAVLEMTSIKNQTMQNQSLSEKAEFEWDPKTKGFVLGIFSLGYLCGPFGGMLGIKFGGTTVFGIGIAFTALLTVLSPFLLRMNFYSYILARLLEGVFESFSMACLSDIFLRWAPPHELCRMMLLGIAGVHIGGALNYPLSGFLAENYGWEAIFFVTEPQSFLHSFFYAAWMLILSFAIGGMTLLWCVFWFILISNDPTTDRLMTHKEREYFKSSIFIQVKKDEIQYPWKQILTSKPFWALLNEFLNYGWLMSFSLYCVPLYIKDVYTVNTQNIGLISAIPNFVGCAGLIISAVLSDFLRSHGAFTKQFLHRGFIATGQLCGIICMLIIGLWANFEQSIILLSLNRFFSSFAETSFNILIIDMFVVYAGLVRGFCTTTMSISYFLNPIIIGFVTTDHSRSSWNMYFLFLTLFNLWSLAIFCLFGSGKVQKWAEPVSESNMNKNKFEEMVSNPK